MITGTFISSTFVCMSYHPSHISPLYFSSGTVAPMNSLGMFELSDVIHSVSRADSFACGWCSRSLPIIPNHWGFTIPETNIAPENGWLEDYFPFGKAYFQGLC